MTEIEETDMDQIHDLITKINKNSWQQNEDIRNLDNLVHVVMGEGVRFPEFRRRV